MTKSTNPDAISEAVWILEHSTGDAGTIAGRVPEHMLHALYAILKGAALADTTQDAEHFLQLAYHLYLESGGLPRQRRHSLRVLPGGV